MLVLNQTDKEKYLEQIKIKREEQELKAKRRDAREKEVFDRMVVKNIAVFNESK